MALDKRTREQLLAHCGDIHDDDGVDPREFFKAGRPQKHKKEDRKARQLCRQVAETLDQVLSGETSDDVLRGLRVIDIAPAPDSSRLLVTLYVDCEPEHFDRQQVEERLACCKGQLRCAIAAAITRRKAPTLVYNIVGPDAVGNAPTKEGGQ
jgi:ribosome-binding factor A